MRSFAIVLLCFVAAAFAQRILQPAELATPPPPPPPTRPPPPPPDTLTDEEGNSFKVVVDRESMQLLNSTGSLVSSVLNSNGWIVVISSDRDVCIISDPTRCPGRCFKLVAFDGRVSDNVLAFCKGRPIMQQVAVPCDDNTGVTTVGPVISVNISGAALSKSVQLPIWPTLPRWSCCCRWRRFAWWPCLKPVCFAYDKFGICLNWGCAEWGWHWHWIQDCVCGWEWPFFLHHG
ncbi:uncharacterized protein LOC127879446 [Dreissena polymorpha]|uniref:Uncharacterized protein n=1 Tax=Dreissena polymorpha TaxID=45954 RepID=A0A9D4KHE9_DREPO|nr:uncharacterized protein LOC127879446 [Dreissena polymorpha]KAH3839590.1 hypothetical protein DPMN_113022 [Dreissena polymorpha]